MNDREALYSRSLYEAACEENVSEDVYDSLKTVQKVLADNEEYIKIVSSANLEANERERLIDEAFEGRIHVFALNFMKILAKKRIFEIVLPCAEEYEKRYFEDNNIAYATITTAFELDEQKKKDVVEKTEKSVGKKIIPNFVVDREIVGGIVIETGNSEIDASVAGKLRAIKRHMGKN